MANDHSSMCMTCKHKMCAKRISVFSTLLDNEIERVSELIVHRDFKKGEMIIKEGEPQDSLIILNSGSVKIFKYNQDGKEQILYIFSEGDFFGEKNLFQNKYATYYAQALDDAGICMINKNDFNDLLTTNPKIALKIIEELASRLEKLENALESMGTKSIEARIGTALIDLSAKYGKRTKRGILLELPLSREGLASYIGVARETVSRKLSALADEGIIEMTGNKKILIIREDEIM